MNGHDSYSFSLTKNSASEASSPFYRFAWVVFGHLYLRTHFGLVTYQSWSNEDGHESSVTINLCEEKGTEFTQTDKVLVKRILTFPYRGVLRLELHNALALYTLRYRSVSCLGHVQRCKKQVIPRRIVQSHLKQVALYLWHIAYQTQ